jgi:hypothetical protein
MDSGASLFKAGHPQRTRRNMAGNVFLSHAEAVARRFIQVMNQPMTSKPSSTPPKALHMHQNLSAPVQYT